MQRCMKCMQEFQDEYDMCPFCGHEVGLPQKELYFLPVGTMIANRYEIGQSAGDGGFGITYRAWDHTLDKEVAVKEYYPVGMVNRIPGEQQVIVYSGKTAKEYANGMVRFLDEARKMATFNTHPNIVNVYDFFEDNKTAYIIMEYLDGITFKEFIKNNDGKVDLETALKINNAVLEALKEVHRAGILHRDISPDNVFICKDGKIKLIDFGAARFSDTEEARTRSVILKPGYAPPEQYQTKSKQGPWTDIYAVGAMLYRAITGVVPEESVNRVEEDRLEPPKKYCEDLNDNQNNAILRAMSILPELRFQTADEFQKALMGNVKVKAVGKELKSRKIRRGIIITIALILISVGLIVGSKSYRNKKDKAAILDEASIQVWTFADENESVEEKEAVIRDALVDYQTTYGQISVEIKVYTKDEYFDAVSNAIENNSLPTLFESSILSEKDYEYLADVDDVLDFVEVSDFYYLNDYKKYYPSKKQFPLSFVIPTNYVNTILCEDGMTAGQLINNGDYRISDDDVLLYDVSYGNELENVKLFEVQSSDIESLSSHADLLDKDENLFMNNEIACLVSDSSKYEEIQKKMAGIYRIELFNTDRQVGLFKDIYSISADATENEQAAAIQVLVYLLAEKGQDSMYVQNGNHLPLNKTVYDFYTQINREYEDSYDVLDSLEFAGEKQFLFYKKK